MRTIFFALTSFCALAACDDGDDLNASQPTGAGETAYTKGEAPANPFFQSLGSNQRTCASCHDPEAGWSVTPSLLQARFDASDGTDPVFRAIDGASAPTADVSTLTARSTAYRLLLSRGIFRVGMPLPANAEFELSNVNDPGNFASATELSLFRRPLPSTNLRFASQVMWDAREGTLLQQATDATRGHAQATDVNTEAMAQIVDFESSLFHAQRYDDLAGDLTLDGSQGGAQQLATTTFQPGMNRAGFTLYRAWLSADTSTTQGQRRAAIARGEEVFNTKTFQIRGVAGLADQQGTCSTCHNTANVGSRATAEPLDLGISSTRRTFDGLPVYSLRNVASGAIVTTTDPGYALVTGRWADLNKFKVPNLRGLAQRPPYFHNGSAQSLDDVVRFYRRRFNVRLSDRDEADLVAFLQAL